MWNLYQNNEFLEPLVFSNGKSQREIVKETLDAINEGHKIIFIEGVCGTGKSAIALNIARKIGKASIIVPGKNLQNQYKRDYEGNKYLLKENGEKLRINIITGRNNHKCKFLLDKDIQIPKIKREIDSKLNDIFDFGKNKKETKKENFSADNLHIPCKIEIKEKNFRKIKEYLKQNKKINHTNIMDTSNINRVPVASVCPYWSPVLPEKYELGKNFEDVKKRTYMGLNNTRFVIYQRKPGCGFYEQFNYFIDSDVIVFNSLKYKLESALNRKPSTDIEIIDECDEFLDSFSNQRNINLDRLQNSLIHIIDINEIGMEIISEIQEILKQIKKDKGVEASIESQLVIPIKDTLIYKLFRILLDSPEFTDGIDDENYLFEIIETAKMFEDFFEDTYLTFDKRDNSLFVNIVTINLAKKFKEMVDKNKIIILMSGTLHSEGVLKNIFGLENFKKIEAETKQQGKISILKTGLEKDCKYSNFSSGKVTREEYIKSLSKCIELAKKPTLVHINSFNDLPSEEEIKNFEIPNLISSESLKNLQEEDKEMKLIDRFKKGEIEVLFSTKCARGVDFPGSECNSIVFTKYPNPNVKDVFWKILKQTKPENYWDFYKDKAKRELLQKIYRGLRSKDDHIYLLSPDIRVLREFEN